MSFPLANAIFWVAVACCTIAQLAIIRSVIISPASRQSADTATPASASRRAVEIAWAVLPGIALIAVLFYTWSAMHGSASHGAAGVITSISMPGVRA